ncbi:DUF1127 domain-containing protein [Hoeflea sp. WL0058]|uniref:DUF1127 domain-containing protein n=1 Tax=Flavimaribacter sediminis TaxID=2865987 RepID=A0AAE2ZV15_9HYPH|nr:DUF1127 domain-containing protein [Flavimaribacter sediminis]MBW8640187.1 DUF1127 domain-containing protein [Flavimaribacter sediminis]
MFSSAINIPGSRIVSQLGADFRQALKHFTDRRQFNRLLDLEDAILDDIGVTRGDVQIASRLPLKKNAALELRRISLVRRRHCK